MARQTVSSCCDYGTSKSFAFCNLLILCQAAAAAFVQSIDAEAGLLKLERYASTPYSQVMVEARQLLLDKLADLSAALRIAVTSKDYRHTFPERIRKVYISVSLMFR